MKKTLIEKTADKLVNAFINNKIIAPIPSKFTKKLKRENIIFKKLKVYLRKKLHRQKSFMQELKEKIS